MEKKQNGIRGCMVHYFSVEGRKFYSNGRLVKVCGLADAWYEAVEDPEALVISLKKLRKKLDIFTFFQRVPHTVPQFNYHVEPYSVAVMRISSYENWWNSIGKNTRYMVKKAQKNGVEVHIADFDDNFIQGISKIYNETPARQGKRFPHYKDSLEKVQKENGTFADRSLFIGAYYRKELVGFMRIVFEKEFADVLQFLSMISHRDKAINNALLAEAVNICSSRNVEYLAYGEMGTGGLEEFKRHNGFIKMELPKYYIPLNLRGKIALRFGFHKRLSELLPQKFVYNIKKHRRWWNEMRITK